MIGTLSLPDLEVGVMMYECNLYILISSVILFDVDVEGIPCPLFCVSFHNALALARGLGPPG
jgi:hypothetical protein